MSERVKASQRIARDIYAHILQRHYNPGERLPTERELAVQYQASRIPVREAVKILEQLGLVESKHGSGNYVKRIDRTKLIEQISQYLILCSDNFDDICGLWDILEGYAVASAAVHRSQTQCDTIKHLADDCTAEIQSALNGQPYAFSESDFALHTAIAAASDNPIVANMVGVFHQSMRIKQSLFGPKQEELGRLIGIHEAIVEGIEKKDPAMARLALYEDLAMGKKFIKDLGLRYHSNELFGP